MRADKTIYRLKQLSRTLLPGRLSGVILSAALLSLTLLLPGGIQAEDSQQHSICLQQLTSLQPAGTRVTRYMAKLIEQRTDLRIEIHNCPVLNWSDPRQHSLPEGMRLAVTDAELSAQQWKALDERMQTVTPNSKSNYQVLVDKSFWDELGEELRIILRGAISDSLNYYSELTLQN